MKLLSVVVPVYNVEAYIEECVESLLRQTYSNIEIILVDDGSTDKSGVICDQIAKQDNRVLVIHQENAGVSHARNVALDNCRGDYITLVDSDDYLLPEAFEVCIENIEKHDLDAFHMGSFRKGVGNGGSREVRLSLEDEHEKRLMECVNKEWTFSWGWVVKRDVWHGLRYVEGKVFEDGMIAPYIFERMNRVGRIDWELYFYRKLTSGICNSATFNPKSRYDHIIACETRLDYAEKKGFDLRKSRALLLKSCLKYMTAYYAVGDDEDRHRHCLEIIDKTKNSEYDSGELGTKYQILLSSIGRFDFVNTAYAKASLLLNRLKKS